MLRVGDSVSVKAVVKDFGKGPTVIVQHMTLSEAGGQGRRGHLGGGPRVNEFRLMVEQAKAWEEKKGAERILSHGDDKAWNSAAWCAFVLCCLRYSVSALSTEEEESGGRGDSVRLTEESFELLWKFSEASQRLGRRDFRALCGLTDANGAVAAVVQKLLMQCSGKLISAARGGMRGLSSSCAVKAISLLGCWSALTPRGLNDCFALFRALSVGPAGGVLAALAQTVSDAMEEGLALHTGSVQHMPWHSLPALPCALDFLVRGGSDPSVGKGGGGKTALPVVQNTYASASEYFSTYAKLLREDMHGELRQLVQKLRGGSAPSRIEERFLCRCRVEGVRTLRVSAAARPLESPFNLCVSLRPWRAPVKGKGRGGGRVQVKFGELLCLCLGDGFSELLFCTVEDVMEGGASGALVLDLQPRSLQQIDAGGESGNLRAGEQSRTADAGLRALAVLGDKRELCALRSPVYYNSVEPVLRSLQRCKGGEDVEPPPGPLRGPSVSDLIVQVRGENGPPEYLQHDCVPLEERVREVERRKSIQMKQEVSLDEKQKKAVMATLSHRLALVQGPPGTGKTFVGSMVAEMLWDTLHQHFEADQFGLRGSASFSRGRASPVLVLTYKNHALDEFSKHCGRAMGFSVVARLGSRSQDEELEACSLASFRVRNDSRRQQMEEDEDLLGGGRKRKGKAAKGEGESLFEKRKDLETELRRLCSALEGMFGNARKKGDGDTEDPSLSSQTSGHRQTPADLVVSLLGPEDVRDGMGVEAVQKIVALADVRELARRRKDKAVDEDNRRYWEGLKKVVIGRLASGKAISSVFSDRDEWRLLALAVEGWKSSHLKNERAPDSLRTDPFPPHKPLPQTQQSSKNPKAASHTERVVQEGPSTSSLSSSGPTRSTWVPAVLPVPSPSNSTSVALGGTGGRVAVWKKAGEKVSSGPSQKTQQHTGGAQGRGSEKGHVEEDGSSDEGEEGGEIEEDEEAVIEETRERRELENLLWTGGDRGGKKGKDGKKDDEERSKFFPIDFSPTRLLHFALQLESQNNRFIPSLPLSASSSQSDAELEALDPLTDA
uniref:DNA2/NAM7 helicase helicase domain-containing protein n=1 Tax=Chromera velia CCMP2878 TaxID=1169474 RepID=A0A0G4F2S1_9ALVE|eukprot:Cvel_14753.t1-p1 / transcript=Cvel_14753.t1 / gene=Cvel_14753 / organism=Chromera_velia_CCMP2878 / gene_product=NFX1-type zinc finger-containing protein 1, putative / transcript_product=NFX1-type zinc finger-containing protein 1, putative / location=Cvel_scaffold1061:44303-47796(-) / protein_length=1062 / sequence_SO=supercontig / SO=protein_coding / is_pseudo=false